MNSTPNVSLVPDVPKTAKKTRTKKAKTTAPKKAKKEKKVTAKKTRAVTSSLDLFDNIPNASTVKMEGKSQLAVFSAVAKTIVKNLKKVDPAKAKNAYAELCATAVSGIIADAIGKKENHRRSSLFPNLMVVDIKLSTLQDAYQGVGIDVALNKGAPVLQTLAQALKMIVELRADVKTAGCEFAPVLEIFKSSPVLAIPEFADFLRYSNSVFEAMQKSVVMPKIAEILQKKGFQVKFSDGREVKNVWQSGYFKDLNIYWQPS